MKELIPKDQYGVFADARDIAWADSLFVANHFEKEHFHVLRDMKNNKPNDTERWLSLEEISKHVGCSTSCIY